MKFGIFGNTTKDELTNTLQVLVERLKENNYEFLINDSLHGSFPVELVQPDYFASAEKVAGTCDILISLGGDGTMLSTAYIAHQFDKPVLGINLGKLGFLAEVDIKGIEQLFSDIKNSRYSIEKRIALVGNCKNISCEELFAVNDLVIDKGGWPKMIELTIYVEGEYVTTFSADGLIIATPTGSTGYSLSVGGPIVSPKAEVIALSPISPHTLTMRPLVLPSNEKIYITVESMHTKLQVNCDGQRVMEFSPPLDIVISKSEKPLKLVHMDSANYFDILRSKLLWGLDVRKNLHQQKGTQK
ncbi:MAG: NAD(+)/NADH kinase [Ignavibacteriaceae bacterium]|jgi:NAD+ kinase|nr:NAD(+)/NADH kinase [Ignavibacteriaceae bacterium]